MLLNRILHQLSQTALDTKNVVKCDTTVSLVSYKEGNTEEAIYVVSENAESMKIISKFLT